MTCGSRTQAHARSALRRARRGGAVRHHVADPGRRGRAQGCISTSVPGSLELTEMLMVLVIFAGAAAGVACAASTWCSIRSTRCSQRWVRRAQRFVVELLCAAALAGVAWLMWVKAGNMMEYGDTTAQLKIPQGPFVYVMSVLCAVTALVHLLLIVAPTSAPPPWRRRAGGACDRSPDRFRRDLPARAAARAVGVRDGLRRLRRPGPDARLAGHRQRRGAGGLRDRLRLHAVGGAAVRADGQLRRPRRAGAGAVPRRLRLHRPRARRPGACHRAGLRRLRRDLRLVDRHRGDDEQGRLPVDEASSATPTTSPPA